MSLLPTVQNSGAKKNIENENLEKRLNKSVFNFDVLSLDAFNEAQWSADVATSNFLADHCVYGQPIYPATAFVNGVLSTVVTGTNAEEKVEEAKVAVEKIETAIAIKDLLIQQALVLSPENAQTVQLSVKADENVSTEANFYVSSAVEGEQAIHVSGRLAALAPTVEKPLKLALSSLQQSLSVSAVDAYYASCVARGIDYGPTFQVVQQLWQSTGVGTGVDSDVPGEALAKVQLSDALAENLSDYVVHPVLLDSCLQMLWAALPAQENGKTYLPVGIDQLKLYAVPPGQAAWSYARLRSAEKVEGSARFVADLYLADEQGNVLVALEGVLVGPVTQADLQQQRQPQLAITATFTADPILDCLNFWQQKSVLGHRVEFAPFNQVFQTLLDPESLTSRNTRQTDGQTASQAVENANAVLVRLEDWDEPVVPLPLQVDEAQGARLRGERLTRELPNGLEITHLNEYETDYLYEELFVDQVYLKHGIQLLDGDCVVDVGANIGLFTLFVQQYCPNGSVYAFEPAPHAFDKLERNAQLYCTQANLFNCGLSSSDRTETFTFYPNSSVFSSFSAESGSDEKAIRAVILNMLERDHSLSEAQMNALADEFIAGRLEKETYAAQLRSLSSIIEEKGITCIDLLKLDAEKSELPVLQGIKDEHWPMIQQMVVEVHDQVGNVIAEVKQILSDRGFEWCIDEEAMLQSSGLYNIYAARPDYRQRRAEAQPELLRPELLHSKLSRNVADFCDALEASVARTTVPHVVAICPPSPGAIAAPYRQRAYEAMSTDLAARLQRMSGVSLIEPKLLGETYAVDKYDNPQGREFGQVPYTSAFFAALGTALTRTLHATSCAPYKVIVLDCDNTLWRGVCGEEGAAGIELSSEFRALQSFMLAQHDAGMLLCLCSKNSEADVWAVFEQRSDEMVLTRSHITQSRINWQPKSENLKSLAAELNLGLDSFIFIDDNPVECAEVEAGCPQVLTLQLPSGTETNAIPAFLDHVWAFDQLEVTTADKQRTQLYQQNIQREEFRQTKLTFGEFLADLHLEIDITPIAPTELGDPDASADDASAALTRVSQLTHRTNQFNATTIRASEREIQQLCETGYVCWKVDVRDRFGDYGTVGVILFEAIANQTASQLQVHSFMLSCRTLGRGVEHRMLAQLGEYAQAQGLESVAIDYIPTAKNQPVLDFLLAVGQDYQQQIETGSRFVFPVESLVGLTYEPKSSVREEAGKEKRNDERSAAQNPQFADVSITQAQARAKRVRQIADERLTPQKILEFLAEKQLQPRPQLEKEFVAPSSEFEQAIAKIWADILSLEQVGIYDSFFDLGGRSLMMVQVHAQLSDQFASTLATKLSPVDLFKYPTVHALAERIEQLAQSKGFQRQTQGTTQVTTAKASDRADRRRKARDKAKEKRSRRGARK